MKRRDLDTAYLSGYESCSIGRPYESCPYTDGDRIAEWQEGWQDARTDDIENAHWMGENPEELS